MNVYESTATIKVAVVSVVRVRVRRHQMALDFFCSVITLLMSSSFVDPIRVFFDLNFCFMKLVSLVFELDTDEFALQFLPIIVEIGDDDDCIRIWSD